MRKYNTMKNVTKGPEKKTPRTLKQERPSGNPPGERQVPAEAERTTPVEEGSAPAAETEEAVTEQQPVTNHKEQDKITNADESKHPIADK